MITPAKQPQSPCPGCQKPVDPLRAPAVSIVSGRITYFCSSKCRERFLRRRPPTEEMSPDVAGPSEERPAVTPAVTDPAAPFPSPTSVEQTVRLQAKLLRPQLILTLAYLCVASGVLLLPPVLDRKLPALIVGLLAIGRIVHGAVRDRRTSVMRTVETAALPAAILTVLLGVFFGLHWKLAPFCMGLLLATESLGRLFELIGRHRSGVLSAVDDSQTVALPDSWRDNSALASRIKQLAILLEWTRYPLAVGVGALTYFVTALTLQDALLSAATVLVGVNPRLIRMATGDAHLSAALMAAKQGIAVRDAHAVDALANARIALFMGRRTLLEETARVVDWTVMPDINEQSLLDTLLTAESKAPGYIAEAITDFASSRKARVTGTAEVDHRPGLGVVSATPWGRLVCGSRRLLLDETISTGLLESQAKTIEASGRRAVFAAMDGRLVAVFGIEEALAPSAEETVRALRHLGMETALLTSAEVLAAESLAHRLGIDTVFFEREEERVGEALQQISGRGDAAVLVGSGPHFEEHLRAAAAAVALGNTERTQAGFDTHSRDLALLPWLFKTAKRANLSAIINLTTGIGAALFCAGIGASWFSPLVVLFAGALTASAAATATFNAPYPLLDRALSRLRAPIDAGRTFLTRRLRRLD